MSKREKAKLQSRAEAALERSEQGAVKPQFFSVNEAETMTGVSRWTWRSWAYSGKIASTKLGKRLLVSRSEIERLINEGTRPAALERR